MPTVDHYLAKAEECELKARAAMDQRARDTYRAAALAWRRLAAVPEVRPAETTDSRTRN